MSPSMPISPNSFTISARRLPLACMMMLRISVVLPAPRKPVMTVPECGLWTWTPLSLSEQGCRQGRLNGSVQPMQGRVTRRRVKLASRHTPAVAIWLKGRSPGSWSLLGAFPEAASSGISASDQPTVAGTAMALGSHFSPDHIPSLRHGALPHSHLQGCAIMV